MGELPFYFIWLSSAQPLSMLQGQQSAEVHEGQLLKLQPASGTPLAHGHHHNPCKQLCRETKARPLMPVNKETTAPMSAFRNRNLMM